MIADFTRRRHYTTRTPQLAVKGNLPVGVHTFELVAQDDSGNRSRPAHVRVIVTPRIPGPPRDGILRPVGPVIVPRPPIIR